MEKLKLYLGELNQEAINAFARSYSVLDYPNTLRNTLSFLFPKIEFENYTKHQLHSLINHVISNLFIGEISLKARLVEMFVEKNVTAAFEIKVNNSRVDFLTLNGHTISYEIKSQIDNLNKLSKQIRDYEKVFEFNYIVIDKNHLKNAMDLIPQQYGIYVRTNGKLVKSKSAVKNCNLQADIQLQQLTKKELKDKFKLPSPTISEIMRLYSDEQINVCFKEVLKDRYRQKWQFILKHKNEIFPVDYQYFFHHNIQPKVIYGF